tara:strand:- start:324 stop:476 length:153 start_codon:yes stop_codon:yes gene_type:complete
MTTIQQKKEYNKLSKRYFKLEEKDFKTLEEQREIDFLEVRLAEIANILEN